jgi:DNA-binding transcriptional LysR family regulator
VRSLAMRSLLALDDLRLVCAVGAAASLTGAARELALDHSTAFRRLNALETRLGVRLFERARDGYTPTEAGQVALDAARRLLDDLADMERRISGQDIRQSGVVRITTPDTLLALLSDIIVALRTHQPGVLVELAVSNSFLALRRRDAHIAVRPARAVPTSLVGRRVAMVATAFYGAHAYLHRRERTGLAQHDWIGFEENLRHLRSAKWIDAHVSERIVYRVDSVLAACAGARAGMGIAALPCYLGDAERDLRRLEEPRADLEVPLWLLTHPDLRRVARVRAVLDFLGQHLAQRRALIEGRTG